MKKISDKRKAQMPIYYNLKRALIGLCNNKSELSGDSPDWQTDYVIEDHHIGGRTGGLYLDPFNIIMLTRNEHDRETNYRNGYWGKKKLREFIRPIRIKQGFKEVNNALLV